MWISSGICAGSVTTVIPMTAVILRKVQLINASGERFWRSMRKSLGSKRREIPDAARAEIVALYRAFTDAEEGDLRARASSGVSETDRTSRGCAPRTAAALATGNAS